MQLRIQYTMTISFSKQKAYKECERKAYFLDKDGGNVSVMQPDADAMHLGSIIHKIRQNQLTIGKKFSETKTLEFTSVMQWLAGDEMYDINLVIRAMTVLERFEKQASPMLDWLGQLTVVSLEEKFNHRGITGVVDVTLQDDKGRYYILDYKTSGAPLNNLVELMPINVQFILYQAVMEQLLGKIEGVILVGISTIDYASNVTLTNAGRLSTDKRNKVTYETVKKYLLTESVPVDRYTEYLDYLLTVPPVVVKKIQYKPVTTASVLRQFRTAQLRINSISSVYDTEFSPTHECAKKCPFFTECVLITQGEKIIMPKTVVIHTGYRRKKTTGSSFSYGGKNV